MLLETRDMTKPPPTRRSPPSDETAPSRAEVLIEAIITDGERRRPGYAKRLLRLLLTPPADTPVTVLRPTAEPDEQVRQSAITWLREASVRAQARAATKRRNP